MKIYTSCFSKLDIFTENCIPISTAALPPWPSWLYKYYNKPRGSYFIGHNNVMLGITEERFSCSNFFDNLEEQCQKQCPYKTKAPHCQFMDMYSKYLETIDMNLLLNEFNRVAEEVRKITKYKGEPNIILMVYEGPTCNCAERPCIQKWFRNHGIEVKEYE